MRSEFCNWFEKRHGKNPHHFTEDYADYTYLKHETGKAWQHQQSKIDELQKRLDAALKMISINRGFAWRSESISQLEQVLNGESTTND